MKILFAGDYVPRNRLLPIVEKGDYEYVFGEVRDIISKIDYAVLNFESPIAEESDRSISKCGPNLRCTTNAVDAIRYAGFKCATLANNHVRDFGDAAVARTMECLKAQGVDYVGAGKSIDDATKVLYKKLGREGEILAIINCCENEFSIASKEQYGANPLNPVKQFYAIKEAKEKADYVVVIVHGGHEHHQLPSPRMQDTYRFFIDAGADIVVNHHQHCYSGYEIYKGKPIVYGMGNFCMDKDPVRIGEIWNYGYMVLWDTENSDKIEIIPYEQCGKQAMVHLLESNAFDSRLKQLNDIITNRALLEKETEKYYLDSMITINNVLEPIQNKYISALQRRHLLPSLLSKKWLLKLQDFILCESHRDKMEFYFKERNK